MPISVNKKLGANDRRSPDGPVISALLSAVVEDDTIVGWMKNSAFLVREVLPDGSLAALDFAAARLTVNAKGADAVASRLGAIGITSRITERRVQEHNTGHLPRELREAAFERAEIQYSTNFKVTPLWAFY